MADSIIEKAPQSIIDLFDEVRREYHPELLAADFIILTRSPAAQKGGKAVFGSVKKASAEAQGLAGQKADYILTISIEDWNILRDRQRRALLDHELSHCQGKEDEETGAMKWGLVGHDIEEFSAVLKRWGAWSEDIVQVVETLQQLDLFGAPDPAAEKKGKGAARKGKERPEFDDLPETPAGKPEGVYGLPRAL